MNKYRIVTDATVDLPLPLIEESGILVIPMECSLGENSFIYEPTGKGMNLKYFYDQMRNGVSTATSQINVFAYTTFFTPILEQGEDILYIAFSSALTGSQQSALIAIEELHAKFPGRRITMIDSLCASLGEGLLVYTAAQKKADGMDLDALANWVNDMIPHIAHWVTVDDLSYLAKGGRISATSAFLGTALRIKPIIHVDNAGRLTPLEKVSGRKRSLKSLVDNMKDIYRPDISDLVFIGHADSPEDAEYVKNLVQETLNCKHIVIASLGPIIGAHAGPGTVTIFHFSEHR